MKQLRNALAALVLMAAPAFADDPEGADGARAVIQNQLDAFAARDVDAAYGFAAPAIKRMFPTPEIFGRMVREGYPMVWAPASSEFLEAEPAGPGLVQRLRFVDQFGKPFIAEYRMIEVDGEWRIAGVRVIEDESFGA